jgi:hypothetical protein
MLAFNPHRAAPVAVVLVLVPFVLLAPGWLRPRPARAQSAVPAVPVVPADAAPAPVTVYRPPVDGPVVDPFRPPPGPYAAGNRGIDYATGPLGPVHASAAGEVLFAGSVGGTLHVTVRHADGLRTSYSFLASVAVHAGQRVQAGDVVGLSMGVVHFGVRDATGAYLDPAGLFAAARRAHLVPGGDDGAEPGAAGEAAALDALVAERRGPVETLLAGAVGLVAGGGPPDLVERTRVWAHTLLEATSAPHTARISAGLQAWVAQRGRCTPVGVAPPAPAGRRILVEVGGIGSSSEQAAVTAVDRAALGYAPGDVLRFSYAGGRTPVPAGRAAAGPLDALAATRYTARDSQGDLREAGSRLARLLEAVALAEPGVPIDVVAHSQGGVVARLALREADGRGRLPPAVRTLVTLGSPHQGADLAGAVRAGRLSRTGRGAESATARALGLDLDAGLPAGAQLSPTSSVIDELASSAPPPAVRLVSVGARGDVVVPANRTTVAGAPSVVVTLGGARAHDRLPGSPEATREIALAVAGREPTCRSFTEAAADLVVSERISQLESILALAAAGATATVGGPP